MTRRTQPPWLPVAAAALAALLYGLYYLGVFQAGFPPSGGATGDHHLLLAGGERLLRGQYPGNQVYPLPALLAAQVVGRLGQPAGFLLWSATSLAALVALIAWGAATPPRWRSAPLAVLALLAAHYGLHWDLRAHNVNLIALLLVWLALLAGPGRPWRAGFLLAASGALKLYALVLLPWLLWRGFRRWGLATLAWLLVFFVVWPLLALGPAEAWRLTLDWLRQALALGDAAAEAAFVATLATLRGLVAELFGRPLTDPSIMAPLWLLRGLLAAACGWALWRLARAGLPAGLRLIGEAAVLGLLPLAFSPVAQPHHAATFLLATLWLAGGLAGGLAQGLAGAPPAHAGARRAALFALLLLLAAAPYLSYLAPGTLHRALLLHGGSLLLMLAVGLAAPRRPASGEGSVAAPWPSVDNPRQEQGPPAPARP